MCQTHQAFLGPSQTGKLKLGLEKRVEGSWLLVGLNDRKPLNAKGSE